MRLEPTEIATRFAEALDREDYAAAAELLDEDCVYLIRGERHVGPAEIIASYKGNGDSAARSFDSIVYGSAVRSSGQSSATIEFSDDITHQDKSLMHRCEQTVTVDTQGRIVRLQHIDLPGERERLAAFKQSCGLSV